MEKGEQEGEKIKGGKKEEEGNGNDIGRESKEKQDFPRGPVTKLVLPKQGPRFNLW